MIKIKKFQQVLLKIQFINEQNQTELVRFGFVSIPIRFNFTKIIDGCSLLTDRPKRNTCISIKIKYKYFSLIFDLISIILSNFVNILSEHMASIFMLRSFIQTDGYNILYKKGVENSVDC